MLGRSTVLALSFAIFSTASASSPEACDDKGTCDAAKGSAMLQVKFGETHGMEAVGKHGGLVELPSLVEAGNHALRSCLSPNLRTASQIARAKYGDACRSQNLAVGTACTTQGVQGKCTKLTGGQAIYVEMPADGSRCPPGKEVTSLTECDTALQFLGYAAARRDYGTGPWEHTPAYCMIASDGGWFNTNKNPSAPRNSYRSICLKATDISHTGGQVPNFCDIGQYAACAGKCPWVSQGTADCSGITCTVLGGIAGKCEQTGTTSAVSSYSPILECKIADQKPEEPKPEPEPEKPTPLPNSLLSPSTKGSKELAVKSTTGFSVGEDIVIDAGTSIEEYNKVVSFGSLILASPLQYDHAAGAVVSLASSIGVGGTAPLDAAGFKAVTSLCCPMETESFFNRLLEKEGYDVCSKPHIQGLMHWFTCVPDMDFQYMLDVIANGNPCKYWSPKGVDCPVLSAACQGEWCR